MSLPTTATLQIQNAQAASEPFFLDALTMAGPSVYGTDVWNKAAIQALLQAQTKDARAIVAIVPQYVSATYYAEYDPVGDAVKVTVKSTGVENATANISAVNFTFLIFSK